MLIIFLKVEEVAFYFLISLVVVFVIEVYDNAALRQLSVLIDSYQ